MKRVGGGKINAQVENRFDKVRKAFRDEIERKIDKQIIRIMIRLTDLILPTVPVWSGETLANWRWSVDHENETIFQPEAQDLPPGPAVTGQENRRRANEDKVRETLNDAITVPKKYRRVFFFSNPAPMAAPLEYDIETPAGRDARGKVRLALDKVRRARS